MESFESPEVVIIGAGIGGGAMACVLARAGLRVLVLEKSLVHKDVVRGEWLSPWGGEEAKKLGLMDDYVNAGGHRVDRHVSYGEFVAPLEAEAQTVQLGELGFERPLCLGHPATCNLLNEISVAAGATLLRGITRLLVKSGKPPVVAYDHGGHSYECSPRWVIGADGRNGVTAKQIGARATADPEHHLFSGMLVADAHEWPQDLQVIATEGDVNVLAFPQGHGKVRIYLGWPKEDRARLVGPDGPKRFLQAWQLDSVPAAEAIAQATPISPCIGYPNADAWTDHPVREGVVLIGDAAGRNDPIIGQGLSITHRDVRLVSDALLSNQDWHTGMFDEYVRERQLRMSRLRIVARLTTLRESQFGESGRVARAAIHERIAGNPDLATPFAAGFVGPEGVPAEVFEPAFTAQIAGGDIWESD